MLSSTDTGIDTFISENCIERLTDVIRIIHIIIIKIILKPTYFDVMISV